MSKKPSKTVKVYADYSSKCEVCGQTPVVNVTGSRFSLNMLSAVGVRGEFSFMVHEGSVNSEVFLSFLKRLMQDATTPVILIVDGHSIHKTKIVKDYVNELAGKLKIYYLPPYSPQLNPDEQVWAHVKREVAKKFVQSKVELEMRINNALNRLGEFQNEAIGSNKNEV